MGGCRYEVYVHGVSDLWHIFNPSPSEPLQGPSKAPGYRHTTRPPIDALRPLHGAPRGILKGLAGSHVGLPHEEGDQELATGEARDGGEP